MLNNWKKLKISQQPEYQDTQKLYDVCNDLSQKPPIVFQSSIDKLSNELTNVANNDSFILQLGPCAETFKDNNQVYLSKMSDIYKSARLNLEKKINKNILLIGRIAGQYAKPRSNNFESKDGIQLPVYRGDMYNGFDFNEKSRKADPSRMMDAYFSSISSYNFLRETTGNLYISHECLNINYDFELTRDFHGKKYCTSAHMLWIGERTRKINEAHVDFLSKIENPIGIKVGYATDIEELLGIIMKINPRNLNNKVILIPRMGFDKISDGFKNIFNAIEKKKLNVLYEIDPMHGNTIVSDSKLKTRDCESIIKEINSFASNFPCHGLHLEITGEDVTECLGGLGDKKIHSSDLFQRYTTTCDPRLNPDQLIYILDNIKI